MRRMPSSRYLFAIVAMLTLLGTACGGSLPRDRTTPAQDTTSAPAKRTAVIGIASAIPAFSFAFLGTSGGGAQSFDELVIKQYADARVLYAAVLAGAADLTGDNSLQTEQAMELKQHWESTGGGKMYVGYGTTRGIFPMFSGASSNSGSAAWTKPSASCC